MATSKNLTLQSLEPLALIPTDKGAIGRFVLTLDVREPKAAKTKNPALRETTPDIGAAEELLDAVALSGAHDVRILSCTATKISDVLVRWTLTCAAFFSEASKGVLSVSCKENPSQVLSCSFPQVMAYDFKALTETPINNKYQTWFKQHRASRKELARQRKMARSNHTQRPTFSIVVPLYKTPIAFLRDAVESILAQTYPYFELLLVNASPEDEDLRKALLAYVARDNRIRIVSRKKNEGIVGNTNAGIAQATGDFVGFMDHDDMLEPNTLFEYAEAIEKDPSIDFLYCDEDLFKVPGHFFDPLFKPDFNRDLLRTHNYVTHFHVIKKSLLDTLLLSKAHMEGAQDYDLTLKATEKTTHIKHIPKVLYHWRAHSNSTNLVPESKPYAEEAGRRAVQEHLDRMCPGAQVQTGVLTNTYRVSYPVAGNPKVSIIIPNKDQPTYLKRCVLSVLKHAGYKHFEVLIVENQSSNPQTHQVYEELQHTDKRVKVLPYQKTESFNYSALINFGVAQATGQYLFFLNNDTEVITDGFLRDLLGFATRPDVGVVGARLLYADTTIQHAGVSVQFSDPEHEPARHLFVHLPKNNNGYHDRAIKTQDYSAVTGACQMTPRALFEQLGGYDEKLAVAFNDVDYCLKARRAGYLVVYDAEVVLYHYESVSRGSDRQDSEKEKRAQKEKSLLFERWQADYSEGDPYLNPNYDPRSPYNKPAYGHSLAYAPAYLKRIVHRALLQKQIKKS